MRLHVKLSAMVLIKKQGVELALAEEELIEYGIIVAFTHGISTFLHQSFAEFFLAKSLLDKIDHDNKDKDKDLELILKESGFFLVRRFLNDLMQNRTPPPPGKSDKDFRKEIEN